MPALEPLYPELRHKLSQAVGCAPPADAAARGTLAPWQRVLDGPSWRALVTRHVLPRLQHALDAELTINPADQQLGPMEAVLSWGPPLLPLAEVSALLLRSFFPKWLHTLRAWLSQGADLEQVSRWLQGWKAMLLQRVPSLLDDDGVRAQLNAALDVINDAIDADEGAPPPPPPPPPGDDDDDDDDDDAGVDGPPPPPPPPQPQPQPPPPPPAPKRAPRVRPLRCGRPWSGWGAGLSRCFRRGAGPGC